MVEHLVLFKLRPDAPSETVEEMMRSTRMQLLKIPEVNIVKCGKKIDPDLDWDFFLSVQVDTLAHLASYAAHPVHVKFVEEVIKPNVVARLALDYEMEPGKDVTYS